MSKKRRGGSFKPQWVIFSQETPVINGLSKGEMCQITISLCDQDMCLRESRTSVLYPPMTNGVYCPALLLIGCYGELLPIGAYCGLIILGTQKSHSSGL